MDQSKLESLIETCTNVFSGFVTAFLVWQYMIIPVMGTFSFAELTVMLNLAITGVFTVVSIVRGYFWRRFFSNGIHKRIHLFVSKIYKGKMHAGRN